MLSRQQSFLLIVLSQDVAACAEEFHANACLFPIPYLKEQCAIWKLCMDADALSIKKTIIIVRLVAELLSEFVEGFFGRLSYKTCVGYFNSKKFQLISILLDFLLRHVCVQKCGEALDMSRSYALRKAAYSIFDLTDLTMQN